MNQRPTDVTILFAGAPVTDFGSSVAWYERLLGRPADVPVHETEVMWRFSDSAWLYVVVDEERAGRAIVTLHVADLDATVAAFDAAGIRREPIEHVNDTARKSVVRDPDGNVLAFINVQGE